MSRTKTVDNDGAGADSAIYWTRVPGQIDRARDILLVRAASWQRAQELLGNPALPVTECHTPYLIELAGQHADEEVFPCSVEKLPSFYDQFDPMSPHYKRQLADAGKEIF